MAKISVVVPTVGRPEHVSSLLLSIAACDPHPAEVLLVDAGQSDEIEKLVTRHRDDGTVAVERVGSERGVSRQRNVGLARAKGDVVVFLDDDVVLEGAIFRLIDEAFANPAAVGVTGRVIEPRGRRIIAHDSRLRRWIPGGGRQGGFTRYGYPRYIYDTDVPRDVEFMPGCFMCARTAAARSVGFDEQLSLAEDEDFSYRLSRLGRILYRPELSVVHRKLGFTSRQRGSFDEQVAWSRRYIFEKNFPQTRFARTQFALLRAALVGHRVVNGDFAGARGMLEVSRKAELDSKPPERTGHGDVG